MSAPVPTSCTQVESAVLPAPLEKVWAILKILKLEALGGDMIKSSSLTSGGEMMVGSVLKVEYSDEAVWELRITEISERTSTVAYEVVSTEPTLDCTSIMGEIQLASVTMTDETLIKWTTIYSSDVSVNRILDQKFKKLEFFKSAQLALK